MATNKKTAAQGVPPPAEKPFRQQFMKMSS
jgi:hypothetical protein